MIIENGLKQNPKSMDLSKEDEQSKSFDYQEEVAPAVPPKIPDSHLEKVFVHTKIFTQNLSI